jgi:hypothetical protein
VGPIATVVTAMYGLWYVLPNFIKQKRLENSSNSAAKALEALVEIEEDLKKITYLIVKDGQQEEHIKVQFQLSYQLNKLRNSLLLLRHYPEIPHLIKWVEDVQKGLEKTLESSPTEQASVEFRQGWVKNIYLNYQRLEELRDVLLRIYELRHQNKAEE